MLRLMASEVPTEHLSMQRFVIVVVSLLTMTRCHKANDEQTSSHAATSTQSAAIPEKNFQSVQFSTDKKCEKSVRIDIEDRSQNSPRDYGGCADHDRFVSPCPVGVCVDTARGHGWADGAPTTVLGACSARPNMYVCMCVGHQCMFESNGRQCCMIPTDGLDTSWLSTRTELSTRGAMQCTLFLLCISLGEIGVDKLGGTMSMMTCVPSSICFTAAGWCILHVLNCIQSCTTVPSTYLHH